MAQRKGPKVDKLVHERSGITIDIRLDKSTGTFFVEHEEISLCNRDLVQLKRDLTKMLEEHIHIAWQEIIVVSLTRSSEGNCSYYGNVKDQQQTGNLLVQFTRCWIGRLPNGDLRMWDKQKGNREDQLKYNKPFTWSEERYGPFNPPCSHDDDAWRRTTLYFLPYDDTTWAALEHIVAGIQLMKGRLAEMLGSKAVIATLANIQRANLLLPEASQEAKDGPDSAAA